MKKFLKNCSMGLALSLCMNMSAGVMAADKIDFSDIAKADYYYDAAMWGVDAGITDGMDDTHFAPDGEVTRAQAVTFLWRLAGEPEPKVTETFKDVEKGSWYEKAVQWAVENEITDGTGDGKFSPYEVCDRAMCIALLYRMMGNPLDGIDPSAEVEINENTTIEELGTFFAIELIKGLKSSDAIKDIEAESYYELPFYWATLNGIITKDNTDMTDESVTFRPNDPCVRKEMISFLYQNKLAQDKANEPEKYEIGEIVVPIPQSYSDILYREISVPDENNSNPEDEEQIITISERASREAAEAMGEDPEGAGVLCTISRVSEARLHELQSGAMSAVNMHVFAKDKDGKYYIVDYPTDVRLTRETGEKMNEAMDAWAELNSWAQGDLISGILALSSDIEPVSYTSTELDMWLARIAYTNDAKYTVSTTEFGPLEPGDIDPSKYTERLLNAGFEEVKDAKAPDGEYVVLSFPEDNVRFDFFSGDKTLVREVLLDEYETFYRVAATDVESTDIMQEWYDALAAAAGKKTAK